MNCTSDTCLELLHSIIYTVMCIIILVFIFFFVCEIRSRSIVAHLPDVKTRMETLSESMMDQSALNDLPETDSGEIKHHYQALEF